MSELTGFKFLKVNSKSMLINFQLLFSCLTDATFILHKTLTHNHSGYIYRPLSFLKKVHEKKLNGGHYLESKTVC